MPGVNIDGHPGGGFDSVGQDITIAVHVRAQKLDSIGSAQASPEVGDCVIAKIC